MSEKLAQNLMLEFADSSGIRGNASPRRYLWTDAFAVCNFLGLYRRTREDRFLQLARDLEQQVHHVLGRHRADDLREGWISGLPDHDGEHHPTCGGLRIGKKLPERGIDEPFDSRREWDRDGQYFHYLTKWMHALSRISQETGEVQHLRWAKELAATGHRAFTYPVIQGGPRRMAWKMSINLRRPLVPSMGHHDPLDGLITCLELQSARAAGIAEGPDLRDAIEDFTSMCENGQWSTDDPLGIGGLLDDTARLTFVVENLVVPRQNLLHRLISEAEHSLQAFTRSSLLKYPVEQRLAFRELGLSIGIWGIEQVRNGVARGREIATDLDRLLQYRPLAEQIRTFWSAPAHRDNATWIDHHDINAVMLATSLSPEGYFGFP